MSTATYLYTGPNSAMTLYASGEQRSEIHVSLWQGKHVSLPADHEVVKTLLSQGLLRPIPATESEAKPGKAKTATLV